MELYPHTAFAPYVITAYDKEGIAINHTRYTHNLLMLPDAAPVLWSVSGLEGLDISDFPGMLASRPDLLIIGTGERYHPLPQKLLFKLISEKIGVEAMTTRAACRTFNLLLTEGRRAALALFVKKPA